MPVRSARPRLPAASSAAAAAARHTMLAPLLARGGQLRCGQIGAFGLVGAFGLGVASSRHPPCFRHSSTRLHSGAATDPGVSEEPLQGIRCPSIGAWEAVPPCDLGAAPMVAFYADHHVVPLPDKHRFPMDKYRATRLELEGDPSLEGLLEIREAPQVSMEEILLVHDRDYAERAVGAKLTDKEVRQLGFPWSAKLLNRSLASSGGTVAATRAVLEGGRRVAACIAGGTHHAFPGHGEGFCVFNDIGIAAGAAMARYSDAVTPILIVDLDVHQGNGTAAMFAEDDRVVTFSMQGANNYPYNTREPSTVDVDLPDACEDEEYLAALSEWLPRLLSGEMSAGMPPKLVFFQAGVDALKEDSFGRLDMTRAGLLKRNNMVYSAVMGQGIPLVISMGGGYSRPWDASVACHADVYRSAAYRAAALASAAAVAAAPAAQRM